MNQGISVWQPWHQVAQKFTRPTFPLRSVSLTSLPFASFKLKSGAGVRPLGGLRLAWTGADGNRLCQTATEHSRHRCASTFGEGRTIRQRQTPKAPVAANIHLLLVQLPRPRNSLSRNNPAVTSASHSTPESSVANRSSTQPSLRDELFLSISLDVLLSERFLSPAHQSPN